MSRATLQRETKHTYEHPGSFERCVVAALELADASSEDDLDYHRALCRFRAAVNAYADRRAAEKATQASQGGPGSTFAPESDDEGGADPCARSAASCAV